MLAPIAYQITEVSIDGTPVKCVNVQDVTSFSRAYAVESYALLQADVGDDLAAKIAAEAGWAV